MLPRRCRNKFLEIQRNLVSTIPYQRIKLQELDDRVDDSARIPKTFEIEARGDLVNLCRVGDIVTVVGIVKTFQVRHNIAALLRRYLHLEQPYHNTLTAEHSCPQLCRSWDGLRCGEGEGWACAPWDLIRSEIFVVISL